MCNLKLLQKLSIRLFLFATACSILIKYILTVKLNVHKIEPLTAFRPKMNIRKSELSKLTCIVSIGNAVYFV